MPNFSEVAYNFFISAYPKKKIDMTVNVLHSTPNESARRPHLKKRPAQKLTRCLWIVLAAGALLTMGCSKTKIAYHFSDWFILRTIDKYFDVNATQQSFLEERIDRLFVWHRKNELPAIVDTLKQLKSRIGSGLKPEDIDWLQEDHRNFFKRFFIHFSPDFAEFLTTLETGQIAHLKVKLEEGNEFLIKQLAMTDAEMQTDAQDWLLKVMAKWTGHLEDAQKERIRGWVTLERSWIENRLKNRRKFQQSFAALLEEKSSAAEIDARLIEWTQKPEIRWSPEFMDQVRRRNAEWKQILVNIDGILTPPQRSHLLQRIQDYIDDFADLAEDDAAPVES